MVRVRFTTRRQRGFSLVDTVVGAAILVMGSLAYFSLVPVIQRAQVISQQQTTAVQIGNRLVEHLLLLKPDNLTATSLRSLNLIDSGQTSSPYSFTNLPMDDGWVYSPSKALPGGTGTMTVTSLTGNAKKVKITISWTGPKGPISYTTGTVIGGYR